MKKNVKTILLGSALWGWGIDKKTVFKIIDQFISHGYRAIDIATNYPISNNSYEYGQSINWLKEWMSYNMDINLEITCKIGSLENIKTANNSLGKSFLSTTKEILIQEFGSSLKCLMIHWDNRDNLNEIKKTIDFFSEIYKEGINIGLSGIKNPEIYANASKDLKEKWIIQVKENILNNKSRLKYEKFFPNSHYQAYGINLGGIKFNKDESRISSVKRNIYFPNEEIEKLNKLYLESKPESNNSSIYDFLLTYIYRNEKISSIIIGPSNIGQLNSALETLRELMYHKDLPL